MWNVEYIGSMGFHNLVDYYEIRSNGKVVADNVEGWGAAKLIAAAPDLLFALNYVLKHLEHQDAIKIARAAIEKAG